MQLNLDSYTEKVAITLLRHLEWQAQGFSLVFFFADVGPSARLFKWLNERLIVDGGQLHQEEVSAEFAVDPESAVDSLIARLPEMSSNAGGLWYELHRHPSDDQWNGARRRFLARLNERRFLLENGLARPLVLVLPADFRGDARSIAPDIWHVRALSEELRAETSEVDTEDRTSIHFAADESVDGDISAYAEWQRIQQKSASDGAYLRTSWKAVRELLSSNNALDAGKVSSHALLIARNRVSQANATENRMRGNVLNRGLKYKGKKNNSQAAAPLKTMPSPQVFNELFISLQLVGDVKRAEGKIESAFAYYAESMHVARKLHKDFGHGFAMNLGLCLSKLGEFEFERGRLIEAEQYERESLSLLKRTVSNNVDSEKFQRAIAVALVRLGNVLRQRGVNSEARAAYLESVDVRSQLVRANSQRTDLRNLAISHSYLGRAELAIGDLASAEKALAESLKIQRKLVEETAASSMALRDLSISLRVLGQVTRARGDLRQAELMFNESSNISRQLVERDGSNSPALRDLLLATHDIGEISLHLGDIPQAMQLSQKSVEIARTVGEQVGWTTSAYRDLSLALGKLANACKLSGDSARAETILEESVEIDRRLTKENKESSSLARDFAISIADLSDFAFEKNDFGRAELLSQEAIEIIRGLLVTDYSPANLRDLSTNLMRLGDIARKKNDFRKAEKIDREVLSLKREILSLSENSPAALRAVSFSLNLLELSLRAQKKYREAEVACLEGLEIDRELVERLGSTVPALTDLATSLGNLALLARLQNDRSRAEVALKEAIGLRRKLSALQPDVVKPLEELAGSLELLGKFLTEQGKEPVEQLEIYEEILLVREKIALSVEKTPRSIADLIAALRKVKKLANLMGNLTRVSEVTSRIDVLRTAIGEQ